MIIAVSCVVAALVVIIGIVVGVVLNNKNKNSYQYNYDKGMSSYQNKDYDNAIKYLAKASKLSEGKKNVDLNIHCISVMLQQIIQICQLKC